MNTSVVGGVVILFAGWMLLGGAGEWLALPGPWNDRLNALWLLLLLPLHIIPWSQFARRNTGPRPLVSTAAHAFITHVVVGVIAVILWGMVDQVFPARPKPTIGVMQFEPLWVEDATPGYGALIATILAYAAASTALAVAAGWVARRASSRRGGHSGSVTAS